MKFTLLVDVEAPECEVPGYSKDTYAIEWLCDQLREALTSRQMIVIDTMAKTRGNLSASDEAYIREQKRMVGELKVALETVRSQKQQNG